VRHTAVAQVVFCLVDRQRGVLNTAAALEPKLKLARQPGPTAAVKHGVECVVVDERQPSLHRGGWK